MPTSPICILTFPRLIFRYGEERKISFALADFNNRCNEFDQKAWDLQQAREKVIKEIDDETLDVRAIVILERLAP